MHRKGESLILFSVLFVLITHFFFVAVYANPFPPATKHKIQYYAQWYAYPYFNQNWNLFVPPPNTNYKLLVSYDDHGKHQTDILSEVLMKHQANRLSGNSAIVLAFTNSIFYFEKNTEKQQALNGPIKNDLYFQILERSAKNYISSTRGIELSHIDLKLCVETLAPRKMKVYYN